MLELLQYEEFISLLTSKSEQDINRLNQLIEEQRIHTDEIKMYIAEKFN